MSIRIIGGRLKGRRFEVPDRKELRPTTDRVRETMFNIIEHSFELVDSRVLDLFAGSGALGIEALSRGAVHATFVEKDRKAALSISATTKSFGLEQDTEVLIADFKKAVARLNESERTFDLILIDPPHRSNHFSNVLTEIFPLLSHEGMVVLERPTSLKSIPLVQFREISSRRLGETTLGFYDKQTLSEQE